MQDPTTHIDVHIDSVEQIYLSKLENLHIGGSGRLSRVTIYPPKEGGIRAVAARLNELIEEHEHAARIEAEETSIEENIQPV